MRAAYEKREPKLWILRILLALAVLVCLWNSSKQSEDSKALAEYFGQEKADEIKVKCTDQQQLEVAETLIEKARQILSYTGSEETADLTDCGALERYYFFRQGSEAEAESADVEIELITTHQENGTGYLWVTYSCGYYDKEDQVITASSDIISRWEIERKDGEWKVTAIDEMP